MTAILARDPAAVATTRAPPSEDDAARSRTAVWCLAKYAGSLDPLPTSSIDPSKQWTTQRGTAGRSTDRAGSSSKTSNCA
jgi:hypothetical protein